MTKVIAIANQKGGVGKTTTTINLGIGLVKKGKKVLLIDADAQANLTVSLGFLRPDQLKYTISNAMFDIYNETNIVKDNLLKNNEGVDLLPSNLNLSAFENQIISLMGRETLLKGYIEKIKNNYDYILIDCSPTLNVITINAFTAADKVIIPAQATYLAVMGLQDLIKTIGQVRRQLNHKIEIEGILITMFDYRTKYSKEIVELLKNTYNGNIKIFDTLIPRSIKQEESTTVGKSIYEYAEKNKVAESYSKFVEEIL